MDKNLDYGPIDHKVQVWFGSVYPPLHNTLLELVTPENIIHKFGKRNTKNRKLVKKENIIQPKTAPKIFICYYIQWYNLITLFRSFHF